MEIAMLHERENVQPRSRVWWWVAEVVLALASCQQVDAAANLGDNARVAVNPAAGRGNPSYVGGCRRESGFFASVRLAVPSMAGRAGQPLGWPVPTTGISTPVRSATHRGKWVAEIKPLVGGNAMPSVTMRAFRALFPVYAIPVSTLPTLPEARALAALLVSRGKRVAIQPAAQGFAVSEVTA
jgi:hypothetical protein